MKTLFALTKNTFRETIRDRILLVIAFFGVLLILATILLSAISARQDEKIIVDLGLGMIDMFGMIITVFVGTQLIFREIDKKTIFLILSKPVSRSDFLLSKFFGLGSVLFLITFIMLSVFIAVIGFSTDLLFHEGALRWEFFNQLLLICAFSLLSFLLLLALVILFSSFMTPMLAAFSSLIVFIIGNITDDIRIFARDNEVSEVFRNFADTVYFIIPNFSILNLKNFVLNDILLSPVELFATAAGAIFWMVFAVVLGTIFFSRKEF